MKTLLKIAMSLFCLIFSIASLAVNVAITMDDPDVNKTPLLTPQQRDQHIRNALSKNHIKIILFVCGKRVDNSQGRELLNSWNVENHILGNHTYSHQYIDAMGLKKFEEDTLNNENLIKNYSSFRKIFRFPLLKEGETTVVRDGFRDFLKQNQYKNGSVTIDTSDWYISNRLEDKLSQNSHVDLSPYRRYYLNHVWNRAQYYDNLARKILHRSPDHILLVHHNLLNALFLDDLIYMFKQKGWDVIDAEKAYHDPLYNIQPNTLPAGESLIWSLAKQSGKFNDRLRYPTEDAMYEKDPMDRLGL